MSSNKLRREYISRINRVIDYVEHNLDKELSLEMLASVAMFSPYHFHRIFKAMVGETINDYCNRIRIQKSAAILISQPEKSITEIALDLGFSSSSHFARSFKKHFEISAKTFREKRISESKIFQNSNFCKPNSNKMKEDFSGNYYLDTDSDNNLRKKKMNVEVKMLPGYRVAYVRVLDGYKQAKIRQAFKKITSWAGARDLFSKDTLVIGISYDDPKIVDADKCRYDTCITVPDNITPDGEIGIKDIPPGKYAVYHVEGIFSEESPNDFSKYWDDLFSIWLPESGYQPDDRDCFEIYYNDPEQHPERKFIADICIPVKPL